jgi:hypothetical protein
MTSGFWICPNCDTENSLASTVCGTCSLEREPDELVGATHRQHFMAALRNERVWRVADVGLGYIVVAARSRALAETKGELLLKQDALADQSVVVTNVTHRGRLVYVRCELRPYPSRLRPWQSGPVRRPKAPRQSPVPREPVEGRVYIGQVSEWSAAEGRGSIDCANRTIGRVEVRRSDLSERAEAAMHAGQHVSFVVKSTPDGIFAVDIMALGPLNPRLSAPVKQAAEQAALGRRVPRRPSGAFRAAIRDRGRC